jgi:hypothetical protein
MAQILKIGKHELEVLIDPKAQGVSLEEYRFERPNGGSAISDVPWGWIVLFAIGVGLLLLANN